MRSGGNNTIAPLKRDWSATVGIRFKLVDGEGEALVEFQLRSTNECTLYIVPMLVSIGRGRQAHLDVMVRKGKRYLGASRA